MGVSAITCRKRGKLFFFEEDSDRGTYLYQGGWHRKCKQKDLRTYNLSSTVLPEVLSLRMEILQTKG
jgi:hypothetical protein